MRKRQSVPQEDMNDIESISIIQDDLSSSPSFLTSVVWCILFTETAERFAYFGFRAILVLYFLDLQYEDTTAIALFAYVASLAYFSPVLGALVADAWWGRFQTIAVFGAVYALGLCILTAGAYLQDLSARRTCTLCGLFLVCMGTGGIKPCVSAFGADQVALQNEQPMNKGSNHIAKDDNMGLQQIDQTAQTSNKTQDAIRDVDAPSQDDNGHVVRAFFAYFYFCINLGAVTGILLVPILKGRLGFGAAFLASTICIILALGAFLSKRHEYVHVEPHNDLARTFRICWRLVKSKLMQSWHHRHSHDHVLIPSNEQEETDSSAFDQKPAGHAVTDTDAATSSQELADAEQVCRVLPVLSLLPMFWMLYDQQGSVWTLQATRMKLYGFEAEQFNIINPVEIMLFIPLFDKCIYPFLEQRGVNISHLRRMCWGMLLCAISFSVSGILEHELQTQEALGNLNVISVFWQLPQVTILAIAEILLSVTGYDFAYSNSPPSLKALVMAVYLLTTAVGDFWGGILYSTVLGHLNRATAMHVCALLMMLNLGIFVKLTQWWERGERQGRQNDEQTMVEMTERINR